MYSLKTSFMPSASVCMMPHGPALFGPMRFWKPAMTLRSNQIIRMTAISITTKATTTLMRTMSDLLEADSRDHQRIEGEERCHASLDWLQRARRSPAG